MMSSTEYGSTSSTTRRIGRTTAKTPIRGADPGTHKEGAAPECRANSVDGNLIIAARTVNPPQLTLARHDAVGRPRNNVYRQMRGRPVGRPRNCICHKPTA